MIRKPRPNHARYLEVLRSMTPQQRLRKAFELSELARDLCLAGLRHRFPDASAAELQARYAKHLSACHNRNS